jgi:hypothetical protein
MDVISISVALTWTRHELDGPSPPPPGDLSTVFRVLGKYQIC